MGELQEKLWRAVTIVGSAATGFYIAKQKYFNKKVSLGLVGLAAVMYAPKGCEVLNTYLNNKKAVDIQEIQAKAKKDSIDAILQYKLIEKEKVESEKQVQLQQSQTSDIILKTYQAQQELQEKQQEITSKQEQVYQNALTTIDALVKSKKENSIAKKENLDATLDKSISGYTIVLDNNSKRLDFVAHYSDNSMQVITRQSISVPRSRILENGVYDITSIGLREGDLSPLVIKFSDDDRVVLSGEGEYGNHTYEIQNRLASNKTGYRVNNSTLIDIAKKIQNYPAVIELR